MMSPLNNNSELSYFTAHLFRENSGKMIAVLARRFGTDMIDDITDVVQDSFEAALTQWKYAKLPENPSAWLMLVAKNKMINRLNAAGYKKVILTDNFEQNTLVTDPTENEITDSQLRLLLFFCQLKITEQKKIILTLYFLCGFGYAEIANALLMQPETVKKTITRSKELLKQSAGFFKEEKTAAFPDSKEEIHLILYLMFNEGYKTTRSENGLNNDLCYEAIRLAKLILVVKQNCPETNALLALMFFNVSRFPARISEENLWVTLEKQNRSLWNPELIQEGFYYLHESISDQISSYYLEALIVSIHCSSVSYEQTDWRKISYLYQQLEKIKPQSLNIVLNRMMAESHYKTISNLITEIEEKEELFLKNYAYLLYLCKAYLYQKNNASAQALKNYQLALDLVKSAMDEKYILSQMKLLRVD